MHDKGLRTLKRASKWSLPVCALFWAVPQFAQDSVSNTPPELKDFRLDPENKPVAHKPTPPEIVGPTVTPESVTPETRPPVVAQPVREVGSPQAQAPSVRKITVEAPKPALEKDVAQKSAPVADSQGEAFTPEPSLTPTDITPATPSKPSAAPKPPSALPPLPWREIAAAALALALAGLAYAFYRRRQSFAKALPDSLSPLPDRAAVPIEVARDPLFAPLPTAVVETKPKVVRPPKPLARAMLDVRFIPAKATISVSTLTIKGELRIINQSKCPAKSMRLRAAVISASEMQNAAITAFHSDPKQGTIEELGPAAADERVAMQIELTIPLSDLKTYPLGDQQLFVPIILANIYYEWPGKAAHDEARITCMVGREANPPQPKMGPFRLDLGPRSFASLGQRPIFA